MFYERLITYLRRNYSLVIEESLFFTSIVHVRNILFLTVWKRDIHAIAFLFRLIYTVCSGKRIYRLIFGFKCTSLYNTASNALVPKTNYSQHTGCRVRPVRELLFRVYKIYISRTLHKYCRAFNKSFFRFILRSRFMK